MKFTEGYWRVRDGFTALHPSEIRDVEVAPDGRSMTAYAPVRRVGFRGDTLSNPVFTITLTAPADGVVAVELEHFAGEPRRGPDFELAGETYAGVGRGERSASTTERSGAMSEANAQPATKSTSRPGPPQTDPHTHVDDEHATFRSGSLTARIDRATGEIEFRSGDRLLTASRRKAIGQLTGPDGTTYTHGQLTCGIGENVYGLGERFGPLVKNGQVVDMFNDDSGTSSDRSYKNVPLYLTNRGYGVFVDHPGLVSFEVGSEKVGRVQFSVPGRRLRYLVIDGPRPADVLERYTALTGRPPRLPAWSYGLWLTTSFTTEYDEATVRSFTEGMAERDIPLSVFHYDCFWMREFRWCDFVWDPIAFPDPAARIAEHHRRGERVCLWINPYIGERSALFAEGAERGYLLRTRDGGVYQTDFWQAGMGLVDFTNPDARDWYAGYLRRLLDMGVDCFKTDFGESVPLDAVYHDGSDPARMHNYYTHLYNRTVHDLLVEVRGEGEAVLFARSATAGGQAYPVHWGGDCESTYEAMAETLRGGLSLAASGFGYWAHDIGGFEGLPTPDLYKRWVAFGLLSSHSRLHGSNSVRVPWVYDDEAVDVLRFFTRLKLSLLPTLAVAAEETVRRGTPMMRPMGLEFGDDPAAAYLDRQYLLGPDLLVAPVFSPDGEAEYYVPADTWTNVLTGEEITGPAWRRDRFGYTELPLLARPGSLLAFQDNRVDTEGDLLDGARLRLFAPEPGTKRHVLRRGFAADAGEVEFTVTVSDADVRVVAADADLDWSLDLGDGVVVRADGGAAVGAIG